jgi:glycosyltransferase involved in cell wall biosynthesis
MLVSIAIPILNEAETISSQLRRLRENLRKVKTQRKA